MPISALSAAKRLCERSGWRLSNLEVQKLVYLAHMFYLGRTGWPLVDGHFEAWEYGPVHPALYHRAKVFGSDPIQNIFHSVRDVDPGSGEAEILDEISESLSGCPSGRLVAITHWEKGAWARNYSPGARFVTIPNDDIKEEYMERERKFGSGR